MRSGFHGYDGGFPAERQVSLCRYWVLKAEAPRLSSPYKIPTVNTEWTDSAVAGYHSINRVFRSSGGP